MMGKKLVAACASAVVMLSAQTSDAEIIISDIVLEADSLSFSLSGSVDVVGANAQNILVIGELGNTSWINEFKAGTWTDAGGTYTPNGGDANTSPTVGHYATVFGPSALSVGDTIEGSFTVTGGDFNPGATDTSQWVVSAGYNNLPLPDPSTVTGAVPEPGAAALLAAGFGLCLRRRRRAA